MNVLRTAQDIEDLTRGRSITRLNLKDVIRLEFPALSEKERALWEVRLNAYKNDCGCSTGAAFCCITLITVAVLVFITALSSPIAFTIRVVALGTIAIFFSGLVGKALGLTIARLKFRRGCAKLLKRMKQHNAASLLEIGGSDV